jgi:uncharacterized RDD family membrane protein YckC
VQDVAGTRETALESGPAPENSCSGESPSVRCAEAGDLAEQTTAWREELAARLSLYRARRKPRPPRYPSLRLVFDPPAFPSANGQAKRSDAFCGFSQDALALDPFRSSDAALVEAAEATAPVTAPMADESSSAPAKDQYAQHTRRAIQHNPPHGARIIEFPRLTSVGPPLPLPELAEPVEQRPRILEVPNVIPPPPALGGISMESGPPTPAERRPGIDFPLQSAPLLRRLVAGAMDAVIIGAACALGGIIFWKVAGVKPPQWQLLAMTVIAPCLGWAAYQQLLIVYGGSTPGLRLAKLELTCFSGKAASRGRRRWRVFASYLSAFSLGMGYVWLLLDEDGLCWHDRITHTYLAPK